MQKNISSEKAYFDEIRRNKKEYRLFPTAACFLYRAINYCSMYAKVFKLATRCAPSQWKSAATLTTWKRSLPANETFLRFLFLAEACLGYFD